MLSFADLSDYSIGDSAIEVVAMGGHTSVTIIFNADQVADEPNESFMLKLEPKPFTLQTFPRGEAVFFRNIINLTIVDPKCK